MTSKPGLRAVPRISGGSPLPVSRAAANFQSLELARCFALAVSLWIRVSANLEPVAVLGDRESGSGLR